MGSDSVAAALRQAETSLQEAGIDAPRIQATTLLAHAMETDRAGLLARLRDPLAADIRAGFDSLIARRLQHEPLQYLVGRADFLDFSVRVGPGVFIPRPETEQLVETALASWPLEAGWAIDICSGSGAVAIGLARARPRARVLAIELSPPALASAARSAVDNAVGGQVALINADLLSAVSRATAWRSAIGCIVCNPPYAATGEVTQAEVRDHEPELAWLAGSRGTEIYEAVIPQAAECLLPGRSLLLELGYGQAESVDRLFRADGRWGDIRVDDDFQGIPRVLTAERAG